MLKSIVEMGKSLELPMVAEGIETQEELELLQQYHCEQGQGFLFSPAVDPALFKQLVLEKKQLFPQEKK